MHISTVMRRGAVAAGLLSVVGLALSGCGGGGSNSGNNGGSAGGAGSTSNTPAPPGLPAPGATPYTATNISSRAACQAHPHQNGRARWTVLVYINAANNLQPDSLLNVAQLASVGSDSNVNIVVEWKQAQSCPYFSTVNACGTTSFVGTHRYYILPHSQADVTAIENGNTGSLEDAQERLPDPTTNTLQDNGIPTSDMGAWQTLQNFVQWGATTYPADHLAVVVWDHGSGALPVLNRATGRPIQKVASGRRTSGSRQTGRAVSQDANTGNQITTQQLAQALANPPQPVDDLIIDCSLQATAEVAFEVRSAARVFVGSEESPPGTGYPYDTWLRDLKSSITAQTTNPCDTGSILVRDTLATYPGSQYPDVTQVMVDLAQMNNVAAAVNAFGQSLLSHVSDQQSLIYNARFNAQYFEFPEYKDLYDFANIVRTSSGVPADLAQSALGVENSLYGSSGAILAFGHGSGTAEQFATGLSIYLTGPQEPSSVDDTTGYDPVYSGLAFASAAPQWPAFLQAQKQ